MSDEVFNVGDRVRVVRVKWLGATPEELATVGQEGTVVPGPFNKVSGGFFIRVELDETPEWWDEEYAIPFVADELELVKLSDDFNIGDRVRVANWPDRFDEPSTVNGLEGKVAKIHRPYLVVYLDTPPEWMHGTENDAHYGLYCRPEELEKL